MSCAQRSPGCPPALDDDRADGGERRGPRPCDTNLVDRKVPRAVKGRDGAPTGLLDPPSDRNVLGSRPATSPAVGWRPALPSAIQFDDMSAGQGLVLDLGPRTRAWPCSVVMMVAIIGRGACGPPIRSAAFAHGSCSARRPRPCATCLKALVGGGEGNGRDRSSRPCATVPNHFPRSPGFEMTGIVRPLAPLVQAPSIIQRKRRCNAQ